MQKAQFIKYNNFQAPNKKLDEGNYYPNKLKTAYDKEDLYDETVKLHKLFNTLK